MSQLWEREITLILNSTWPENELNTVATLTPISDKLDRLSKVLPDRNCEDIWIPGSFKDFIQTLKPSPSLTKIMGAGALGGLVYGITQTIEPAQILHHIPRWTAFTGSGAVIAATYYGITKNFINDAIFR